MFRIRRAALAVAGLLALSACGGLNGSAQPRPDGAAQQPADEEVVPDVVTGVTLAAATVGPLGAIVTDQNGRTLYRSDKDKVNPSVSMCNNDCVKNWPPVTVEDPAQIKLDDIDKSLVGTVERADGTTQIILAGRPLYRSVKDSKAGDINGQGVGGTWFAATPQGNKAQEAKKAAPPTTKSGGGSGY